MDRDRRLHEREPSRFRSNAREPTHPVSESVSESWNRRYGYVRIEIPFTGKVSHDSDSARRSDLRIDEIDARGKGKRPSRLAFFAPFHLDPCFGIAFSKNQGLASSPVRFLGRGMDVIDRSCFHQFHFDEKGDDVRHSTDRFSIHKWHSCRFRTEHRSQTSRSSNRRGRVHLGSISMT